MQFFFYGLAHVRMGVFMFVSWVIYMSMLIYFSYVVGIILIEWRQVRKTTYAILFIALASIVKAFISGGVQVLDNSKKHLDNETKGISRN